MSSSLLTKSDENLASAGFLKEDARKFYNTSAHCSYYGCLQIIKHLLIFKIYGSEDEILSRFKEFKDAGKRGNTHAFYISTVYKRLKSDGYKAFASTFNEHMTELKTLRETSAYGQTSLSSEQSENAFVKSKALVRGLKSLYKL